jgi:hypothetical protein
LTQDAILVDDMIDTGTTLKLAANVLAEKGAKSIYAIISHGEPVPCTIMLPFCNFLFVGLLSEANLHTIDTLPIIQLVVTNTVPQRKHSEVCKKLVTIDISPTLAESIRRTHNGESISLLFSEWADPNNSVSFEGDHYSDHSGSGSRTPSRSRTMNMTMSAMSPIVSGTGNFSFNTNGTDAP